MSAKAVANFIAETSFEKLPPGVVVQAKKAIRECLNLGVKKVWLYPGSKCDEAIDLAKKGEIDLIYGVCPLLYLEPVKFPHSLHRWVVKVLGKL